MKTLLAVLAFLAVAPLAQAQNVDTQSDSYLCYHGSATDPKTDAACQRIEAAANKPVAAVAPPKPGAASAQNTTALAVTPNGPTSSDLKGHEPAAAANPTDVGESPANGQASADETTNTTEDNGETDVSIHPGLLAGLGALAIIGIAIGAFIALAIHFIPTIIAIARRKRNAVWIFLVNLFLGWTVIGWIWALIWSLMTDAP